MIKPGKMVVFDALGMPNLDVLQYLGIGVLVGILATTPPPKAIPANANQKKGL